MSSNRREFRVNNVCGRLTSFKMSEYIQPVHFVLLASLGDIWYEKYTNTAV